MKRNLAVCLFGFFAILLFCGTEVFADANACLSIEDMRLCGLSLNSRFSYDDHFPLGEPDGVRQGCIYFDDRQTVVYVPYDTIKSVTTKNKKYSTNKGIKVGDSVQKLLSTYKDIGCYARFTCDDDIFVGDKEKYRGFAFYEYSTKLDNQTYTLEFAVNSAGSVDFIKLRIAEPNGYRGF